MRKHQGFTLIEVIVAVSVIVILMGLLVVGGRVIFDRMNERTTRTALANAQAMLAELEATAGLSRLPRGAYDAPGVVNEDVPDRTNNIGVIRTREVFAILRSVPKNKSAMDQLPSNQLLVFDNTGSDVLASTPILLDGWNNPILFVPPPDLTPGSDNWDDRYGLRKVGLQDESPDKRVVNPGGLIDNTQYPSPGDIERLKHYRPFFVSAGPDGNFQTHDDNIYSFEN